MIRSFVRLSLVLAFSYAPLKALGHAIADHRPRISDAFLDSYENVELTALTRSGQSRTIELQTRDLLIENSSLVVLAREGILDSVQNYLRGEIGQKEARRNEVRVIPFSSILSFEGKNQISRSDRRFLAFGEVTKPEGIPDGGLIAIRGPRTLINRDHFGYKYTLNVRKQNKQILVSETGRLVELEQLPSFETRTTNDARRLNPVARAQSMREVYENARVEMGSSLGALGEARDFQPGQVRRSDIPKPEEHVKVYVKTLNFGGIPGPVVIQDDFIVGAEAIYFPNFDVRVDFDQITGLLDVLTLD